MLKNDVVYLRALEPTDLNFLYQVENNTNLWHVSGTQAPYSKYILEQYLQNATQDIYQAQQLRLAICTANHELVGLLDLFDFSPQNSRAGVGIVIAENKFKQQGYAKNALQLLIQYCFTVLNLNQLYANIEQDNTASLALFKAVNFELVGIKKQWNKRGNQFIDEALYQLINK
ncbi:GNAT family N-acetyltransferase [Flavobacterium agricola]|uniref:GNAT family N-acetyltransferase n=1 Tax=Flavobacterium agricola TaxID=2870839 RepID=A0ABY6M2Q6_9FLAO|nr:GNAT family protein [Flavobacterium agricola]UYW01431.1 GNAT family N-acetyltransferase [Flavobacterium agricola]